MTRRRSPALSRARRRGRAMSSWEDVGSRNLVASRGSGDEPGTGSGSGALLWGSWFLWSMIVLPLWSSLLPFCGEHINSLEPAVPLHVGEIPAPRCCGIALLIGCTSAQRLLLTSCVSSALVLSYRVSAFSSPQQWFFLPVTSPLLF